MNSLPSDAFVTEINIVQVIKRAIMTLALKPSVTPLEFFLYGACHELHIPVSSGG